MRIGDRILTIDNENAAGIAISDAVKKISGEIGTQVSLTILRIKGKERESMGIFVSRTYID